MQYKSRDDWDSQYKYGDAAAWKVRAYGGTDYNCNADAYDGDDGLKYLEINIKEDGNLYENIDQQHLLFTGEKYIPKKI